MNCSPAFFDQTTRPQFPGTVGNGFPVNGISLFYGFAAVAEVAAIGTAYLPLRTVIAVVPEDTSEGLVLLQLQATTSEGDNVVEPDDYNASKPRKWVKLLDTQVAALAGQVEINAQTGTSYELVASDRGKLITLTNEAAVTVEVPANADVPFPIGTEIALAQLGAGQVTIAGQVGVTINGIGTAIESQFGAASLVKYGTNTWLLVGGLELPS